MSDNVQLKRVLASLEAAVMDDGVISLGETSVMMRAIRPFVLRGDADANELQTLLTNVRKDGIVTHEESQRICSLIGRIFEGRQLLAEFVRVIPDFPKPGVIFRDVTGIIESSEGFNLALSQIEDALDGVDFDLVAAPESRGFIFGSAIAARHGCPFVPIRKPGKLPREVIRETYQLEYGEGVLEMHSDAVIRGERAVVVDDLLATGGTARASARLIERLGGKVVKMIFPIELEGFGARVGTLKGYDVASLVKYPGK